MRSEQAKKNQSVYKAQYEKENNVQKKLKLSKIYDADILAYLDTIENFQGYIKRLIREDIQRSKEDKEEQRC